MPDALLQQLADEAAIRRVLDEYCLRLELDSIADWLELFTEDGHYWMPLAHGQTDTKLHASLMYEDKLLLKIRVERLQASGHGEEDISTIFRLKAPLFTRKD